MSFFIDEINLFSSIDLFKVKPDYQARDEIETKISTILPYKHTINVEGSSIKVELFHSDVTDEQLAKIETVINDTFKACQKYVIILNDKDVNFRMFLFEDREQYVDMKKSLYASDTTDQEAGVTIPNPDPFSLSLSIDAPSFKNDFPNYLKSPSDVLIYAKDNFSNDSKSFEEIDYHTLAHEFVHCIQRIVTQFNKADLSKSVTEGSANLIACEALHEEKMCKMLEDFGSCKIKSHDLNLGDVYYAKNPIVNEDPYSTGILLLPTNIKFVSKSPSFC
ncbi:MAG: hypothetical protein ACEY3K_03150 [Wolbachia sp.]